MMICFETIFLSLVALPFGLLSSYFIVEYYSVVGIDLSVVEAGLENFGVGTRLYFKVPDEQYYIVAIMVFIISIISSIFPSLSSILICFCSFISWNLDRDLITIGNLENRSLKVW